jgi:hypothetical protein
MTDLVASQKQLILRSKSVPIVPSPPSKIIRHYCSPACLYHEQGCIYICLHSNNVHFCSLRACDHLVVDAETQVCSITAQSYPLDCVIPVQYECAQRTMPRAGPSTAAQRSAKRVKLNVSGSTEKHEAEAMNLLKSVLSPIVVRDTGQTLFASVSIEGLIQTCETLWKACVQTEEYSRQPFRYRHKYHVLVVLYVSIKGLSVRGVQVIPANALIRRWLPPSPHIIKSLKELDQSTFTNTNKMFLACMTELYKT